MEFNVKLVLMATVLILGCISNGKSAGDWGRGIGVFSTPILSFHRK